MFTNYYSHLSSTFQYNVYCYVVLLKEIKNEDAENLVVKCPVKVFDIEDIGNGKPFIF